ncbi:MAG: sigma 54-interacting transcriptional regulator [Polyangiaceae bacterium]
MNSDPASTLDAEIGLPQATDPSELALVCLTGVSGSTELQLGWSESGELTIGRDADCAIRLTSANVSRRHAALRRSHGEVGWSIADLGSRNGTRVNGHAVQTAVLRGNDVVRVGDSVFIVTASPGPFKEIAPGLVGGAALQRALSPLLQGARSDLPIVLEGETGTGKEVVTRAVHEWSGRPGPLVAVNCAALPQGLAEGELFGYRRGAFTGADRANPGFFRSAEGGTLLLDEISDLPLLLQAKLLRALEQKEVQPLGETRPVPVDVRIIVAGQQSLLEAVQKQLFRADLLARLNGFTLRLPTLRQRREDILPLFLHFMGKLRQQGAPECEPDFVERLCLHDWPFNVRELLLLARRLAVFHADEPVLRAQYLPDGLGLPTQEPSSAEPSTRAAQGGAGSVLPERSRPREEALASNDSAALVAALRAFGGNVTRAAAELGITRQRAYRLLEGQSVDLAALAGKKRPKRPSR